MHNRLSVLEEEHHGTAFDLAHDGSSLPDMLGLRLGAPWLGLRVHALLPRLNRATLLEWVGAPTLDAEELDRSLIGEAALAAWALATMHGKTTYHLDARRAAVHLFDRLGAKSGAPRALGIPARSITRYRRQRLDAHALRVLELQLRWRALLRRREAAREAAGAFVDLRAVEA